MDVENSYSNLSKNIMQNVKRLRSWVYKMISVKFEERHYHYLADSLTKTSSSLTDMRRLLILVRSLNHGGAQRQLLLLVSGLREIGWEVTVATFYVGNEWDKEAIRANVELYDLRKKGRWEILRFLMRLVMLLRQQRPVVLHGYLDVPNLITILVKPLVPGMFVVWGVRASNIDLARQDFFTRLVANLTSKMSRFADRVIVNSQSGLEYQVARGYPRERVRVIPNGIDIQRFKFDFAGRIQVRAEWGVSGKITLIGLVGRLDQLKDHPTFLRAAALLVEKGYVHCQFVCVGAGPSEYMQKLRREAMSLGLRNKLIWAGAREDMSAVYSAFDIACLSSRSEGLPNVVIEAMACERPCVVTDVGDASIVVGDTGLVVPPGDPRGLCGALEKMVASSSAERQNLGKRARLRVATTFSATRLTSSTSDLLEELVTSGGYDSKRRCRCRPSYQDKGNG